MPLSRERRGENEAFFRDLNERLESHALAKDAGAKREFQPVCECVREECTVRLRISFAEYERIRDDPTRFIVAPGHADARIEAVVKSLQGYDVVEKLGEVARVARRLDPRDDE